MSTLPEAYKITHAPHYLDPINVITPHKSHALNVSHHIPPNFLEPNTLITPHFTQTLQEPIPIMLPHDPKTPTTTLAQSPSRSHFEAKRVFQGHAMIQQMLALPKGPHLSTKSPNGWHTSFKNWVVC